MCPRVRPDSESAFIAGLRWQKLDPAELVHVFGAGPEAVAEREEGPTGS